MKYVKKVAAAFILLSVLLCCLGASSGNLPAWGCVHEQDIVLYLLGADPVHTYTCQVGNTQVSIQEAAPVSSRNAAIETVVVADSAPLRSQGQHTAVQELLEDCIANRVPGEKYTIVTLAEQINYLCLQETDYSVLKDTVTHMEAQEGNVNLTDSLYQIIDSLRNSDDGTLRRIIIFSDGKNDGQVGYTREELSELIRTAGYPIYTIGGLSESSTQEDLQNLFALSRLTSGGSFELGKDSMTEIFSQIMSWNESVYIQMPLPAELCDGSQQMLRLHDQDSGNSYVISLQMPFADVSSGNLAGTQVSQQNFSPYLWIVIAGAAGVLIAAAVVVVIIVVQKRGAKSKSETTQTSAETSASARGVETAKKTEIPQEAHPADTPTEVFQEENVPKSEHTSLLFNPQSPSTNSGSLSNFGNEVSGPGTQRENQSTETKILFGSQSGVEDSADAEPRLFLPQTQNRRLILQDIANPNRRYEEFLTGSITIGRESTCRIMLGFEASVSRNQCEIYEKDGEILLRNLSQSNITQVDGVNVTGERPLTSGCIVKMGRLSMRVEII